jgi:hypothetical protein
LTARLPLQQPCLQLLLLLLLFPVLLFGCLSALAGCQGRSSSACRLPRVWQLPGRLGSQLLVQQRLRTRDYCAAVCKQAAAVQPGWWGCCCCSYCLVEGAAEAEAQGHTVAQRKAWQRWREQLQPKQQDVTKCMCGKRMWRDHAAAEQCLAREVDEGEESAGWWTRTQY